MKSNLTIVALGVLLLFGCSKDTVSSGTGRDAPKPEKDASGTRAIQKELTAGLLEELQSGDVSSRMRAAEQLCSLGFDDEGTVSDVAALLLAPAPETREAAAYALG
jgi:hypothetical protein